MTDEENLGTPNNAEQAEQKGNEADYIQAIKELRENTVPKADYSKLQEENKQLINALSNGETIPGKTEEKPDIAKLRAKLQNENLNNLEFIETSLALRKAVMDEGGEDIFVPQGNRIAPTEEDRAKAANAAKAFQECVEYANGDPQLFTVALQARTIDTHKEIYKPNNQRGEARPRVIKYY